MPNATSMDPREGSRKPVYMRLQHNLLPRNSHKRSQSCPVTLRDHLLVESPNRHNFNGYVRTKDVYQADSLFIFFQPLPGEDGCFIKLPQSPLYPCAASGARRKQGQSAAYASAAPKKRSAMMASAQRIRCRCLSSHVSVVLCLCAMRMSPSSTGAHANCPPSVTSRSANSSSSSVISCVDSKARCIDCALQTGIRKIDRAREVGLKATFELASPNPSPGHCNLKDLLSLTLYVVQPRCGRTKFISKLLLSDQRSYVSDRWRGSWPIFSFNGLYGFSH
mmetsp:Transcript_6631/g.13044  ORF Transcript_6631/g.13044 Transcript_6631/m.13044 type:complete len:278 (+) Transcript_6631:133-966(+)